MVKHVYELDCLNVDLRPFLYGDIAARTYKHGTVYASHTDDGLAIDGTAHGRPLHVVMAIQDRRRGLVGTRRAACSNCGRWVHTLRVFPNGTIGCRVCRPFRRRAADPYSVQYRRHPDRLVQALEGTPREREVALRALAQGPIRGKRPTRFPSRRILRGEYEPWPEELLALRFELTGYYPYE